MNEVDQWMKKRGISDRMLLLVRFIFQFDCGFSCVFFLLLCFVLCFAFCFLSCLLIGKFITDDWDGWMITIYEYHCVICVRFSLYSLKNINKNEHHQQQQQRRRIVPHRIGDWLFSCCDEGSATPLFVWSMCTSFDSSASEAIFNSVFKHSARTLTHMHSQILRQMASF